MTGNIPVPAGPVAPFTAWWMWWIAPPALLTWMYRLVPARVRGWWNPAGTSNSHLAMAAIVAGGGWAAFWRFAVPQVKDGIPFWLDG